VNENRPRHRFAVTPADISAGQVRFGSTLARQMRRVLRLRPGDRVIAFDGRGVEYTVALISLRDEAAIGAVESEAPLVSEPRLRITLFQSLLPRERFEHVLQKGTEVGISCFVPLAAERCVVPAESIEAGRLQRWQRILAEASEQSGRGAVPELTVPQTLQHALAQLRGVPALLAWERETRLSLRQALHSLERRLKEGSIAILVGPEGGFTQPEALAARAAGAVTVSLGPRVLRAETAGPLLAALILYESGDLEPAR
jgi:16S rRNA (uracil1498-N3)-methyltransferase